MHRQRNSFGLARRLTLLTVLLAIHAALPAQEGPSRVLPPSDGAPNVGEKIPDFTLPDSHGKSRTLSDLIQHANVGEPGWVLLVFYRGYW